MQTFEERYTAWIDGKLTGAELAAFERELADRPAAHDNHIETLLAQSLCLRRHYPDQVHTVGGLDATLSALSGSRSIRCYSPAGFIIGS